MGWASGAMGWIDARRPKTLWVNIVLALLLILALVLAIIALTTSGNQNQQVRTVAVTRGTVTASVSGSGNTESSLSTPVNFVNTGIVKSITVNPGDTVTVGQVLATIDPTSANDTLRSAQATLASATTSAIIRNLVFM